MSARRASSFQPGSLRGFVESRGPDFISGWAAPAGGDRHVTLVFELRGRVIGECEASEPRPDLIAAGVADGCAAFAWRLPLTGPQIDVTEIAVSDKATGARLADALGVVVVQPSRIRGVVEARGPDVISGWASGRRNPLQLILSRGGEVLAEVCADIAREELARAGIEGGRAGFEWRLPFLDPPLDPAEIEVREAQTGDLIPDVAGLKPAAPARVRGLVELRGPMVIAGWARGPGGPVRLELVKDGEVVGHCVADRPRPGSGADAGAGFQWVLPFLDPPFDPAGVEVREVEGGLVLPRARGLRPVAPAVVRGWVEEHGPDVIAGWAYGPGGAVSVQIRRGDEVLAEMVADDYRADLARDGVGDGRVAFRWTLPLGDPGFAAADMRVVEVAHGVEIPDAPGLVPVSRAAVCGVVEERSYRLVTGWAWDGVPGSRTELDIVCDGQVVGRCVADRLRKDLRTSGVDDGRHAFHWIPPGDLESFDAAKVRVIARASGVVLPENLGAAKIVGLEACDLRIEGGWLHGRLRRTGEIAPAPSVDLVVDGRFLINIDIRALDFGGDGWAELQAELPRTVNDFRPRRVTLHDSREGGLIPGGEFTYASAINSMVELFTPHEIRGWVIDPDDPEGEGRVDLYDGEVRLRRYRFGRDRPEVAKAMGADHAWEFVARRLPLSLFDGRPHHVRLVCDGRELSPHKTRELIACWTPDQAALEIERYGGAAHEINAGGVKGYAIDYLRDAPLELEVLVDGEVVARPLANRYIAGLKEETGHGFHGFSWRFPPALMNGGRRKVAVRLAESGVVLAPKAKSIAFPLVSIGEAPPPLAPPMLAPPQAKEGEPALLSLIVLNLNGAHVLEPFLRSLAETAFRDPMEIILIDHGSTDDSRAIVEAWRDRLPLWPLYRGANHSFSASCNLGAALARGGHLVMVNNDIVFTGDCLAGMRELLDADPEVGMVGLRLLEPRYLGEGRWEPVVHHTGVRFEALAPQAKGEPRMYHPVEVEEGGERGAAIEPGVTAALAMMRKADFRALGGFDEDYVYGYEDVDLALRMRGRLGKLAVCRLDDSAIHNRSATRESKLVAAEPRPKRAAADRPARANLDLFLRRFSRHLPRLILRQLVTCGEAWRAAPLRVTFVVGDPARGDDAAAARALGQALRDRFGWEPMLIAEDGHDLAVTDVLVSLRPGYDLRKVVEAAPGMIAVAWQRTGQPAWEGRAEAYHLALDLPEDPARAATTARAALTRLLDGKGGRVAIKAQAENEPQARALAQALERRGRHVRLDGPRHWNSGLSACDELVVAMAGVKAYAPFQGAVNALCLAPGSELPAAETLAAFDHVFAPGDAEADAAVLIELHERLRREFLGRLAD